MDLFLWLHIEILLCVCVCLYTINAYAHMHSFLCQNMHKDQSSQTGVFFLRWLSWTFQLLSLVVLGLSCRMTRYQSLRWNQTSSPALATRLAARYCELSGLSSDLASIYHFWIIIIKTLYPYGQNQDASQVTTNDERWRLSGLVLSKIRWHNNVCVVDFVLQAKG